MRLRAATGVLVLTALAISGCAGNIILRPRVPTVPAAEAQCPLALDKGVLTGDIEPSYAKGCETSALESSPHYKLAVVEFDDQGRLRADRQFTALFDLLHEEARKADRTTTDTKRPGGVSIVVFVHGWRHNAVPNDENIKFARRVLYNTHLVEKQGGQYNPNSSPRTVIGIYVGWRGKSLTSPAIFPSFTRGIEVLSFWDRKFSAERIATGSVRELFAKLKNFRDRENTVPKGTAVPENCKDNRPGQTETQLCRKVRLLIVGHSFGGLLVFNAISESLIRSVTQFDHGKDEEDVVGEYADLVVLVNPAIEGSRYEPLHQAVLRRKYSGRQLPIFVAVTAANDWATRYAFCAGRIVNSILEDESPQPGRGAGTEEKEAARVVAKEEREANISALGHVDRFKTHVLALAGATPKCGEGGSPRSCLCTGWNDRLQEMRRADGGQRVHCEAALQEQQAGKYFVRDERDEKKDRVGWELQGEARYRDFCGTDTSGLRLTIHKSLDGEISRRKDETLIHSPVWIVASEDTRIINGHSGFTDKPLFSEFLVQLYHDRVMLGRGELLSVAKYCQ